MILADLLVRAVLLAVIALFVLGTLALLTTGPLVAPDGYDEPPSRLDRLDPSATAWIEEWEASRTIEAARERTAARLGWVTWGECPECGQDDCWCRRTA